jgi:hypothetical protein
MAPHLQVDPTLHTLCPQLGLIDKSGLLDINVSRFKQADDRRLRLIFNDPFPSLFTPVSISMPEA